MSWHFLQAGEEESWEGIFWDGAPDALLKLMPTQEGSFLLDNETDACRNSQSGTTCGRLTESHGVDQSTSSPEDSHAKTSVQPEEEPELKESEAVFGNTWQESLAKYNPDTHSWKTHQCLWEEDLPSSSLTLPRWGMMRDGVLWEQTMPELTTYENASGFWPTPTAHNAKEGAFPAEYTRNTPTLASRAGGKLNPTWVEYLMGWPLLWTSTEPMPQETWVAWKQAFAIKHPDCDALETDKFQPLLC